MAAQNSYSYRIYRDGRYLGELPKVHGPFKLVQEINSAFSQLTISVGIDPDTANQVVAPLLDELGNNLLDESDNILYEERVPDVYGNYNDNALIRTGNDIIVYEFSDDNPNGVVVFAGFVEKIIAHYASGSMTMVCLSDGADLNDYVLQTGGFALEVDQSVASGSTGSIFTRQDKFGVISAYQFIGQTLTIATGFNCGKISVKLDYDLVSAEIMTLKLYTGSDSYGTLLATSNVSINGTAAAFVDFTFSSTVALAPGPYFFSVETAVEEDINFIFAGSDVYAGGGSKLKSGVYPSWSFLLSEDIAFRLYSSNSSIDSAFSVTDPTTILTTAIDDYVSQGGLIDYAPSSTDLTGLTATYTFKLATILEVIKKCLELAPYDWYWRVDPATGILYFKQTSVTATHTFIRGRHISDLDLTITAENIRNVVYFSGGPTAGVNLFTSYINNDSIINTGRRRLERRSDNRVTLQATADLFGNNTLNEFAAEEHQTPLTVLASAYDISTIKPGDTVRIAGYGNFIDNLILRIARVVYSPTQAELVIGKLPHRQTSDLAQALNDINDIQTVDNPSAPS